MYGKIFASLYQGTLRGRAHEILVFTNMIACADQYGVVDKHPRAIAEETGLTLDQTREAIAFLEAPDPESRTPEYGGARITKAFPNRVWGWSIVNYLKYRAMRNEEDRREQNRLAQERWRASRKPTSADVSQDKPASAEVSPDKPKEKEKEKEKNREAAAIAALESKKATAATQALFSSDPSHSGNQPMPSPIGVRNFGDWRVSIGLRVWVDRTELTEWHALWDAEGWDSMTKGYKILCGKIEEPKKIHLSHFLEIRK